MNRTKYNNKKIKIETGTETLTFDSKKEYDYYCRLKEQNINFDRQVKFELQQGYVNGNGEKIRSINYYADYVIYDEHNRILQVIDVKSPATVTEVFKLKRKLFEMKYKPLTIDLV